MVERDPRWDNVEAGYRKLEVPDEEGGSFFVVRFRITLVYEGMFYWQTQDVFEDDLADLRGDPQVLQWIWNEMIAMMDERLDGTRV